MRVSNNLKEVLNYLGEDYSPKEIDREICAYRKLNNYYDIEISGCNRKTDPFNVYIWDITNGTGNSAKIVRRSGDIKTKLDLKDWLDNNLHDFNKYHPKVHEK